jgi:predicted secreted protein
MADAIKTAGTTLYISTEVGSPQAFVSVANVTDFSKSGERNIIGTTNLSSAAATKMAGLLDEGQVQFSVNYDPSLSSHQALWTAYQDGSAREFKIVLTDSGAAELHFSAIVRSMPINGPFDDKVTSQLTLEITGAAWITY